MARMPVPTRESVPEKYRDLFDQVVKERGGPPTSGPGSVTLNSPEIAQRTNHLSAYLRQGSGLPANIQELAMLTTARELDCQYIWNAHAASGRQAGLSDALVDAIRDNKRFSAIIRCHVRHRSSVVEQRFRKAQVGSSNLPSGSRSCGFE